MVYKKNYNKKKSNYKKKSNFKKKSNYKRNYRKGPTMNQIINKMCITKVHQFAGLEEIRPFGTSVNGVDTANWYMVNVAALARDNGNTATADVTNRESSRIHYKNFRLNFNILPNRQCYAPLQYRYIFGYFKGDDSLGTQGLTPARLTSMFPKMTTNVKLNRPGTSTDPSPTDMYVKYQSKVFTCTPKMVYDANGSDDSTSGTEIVIGENTLTEGAEPMRGVWLPKSHKLNFQVNRTLTYEDGDGDSLNGWCPFWAIQCLGIEYPFSKPNIVSDTDRTKWGRFPSPRLQIDATAYFCDIH